MLCDLISPAIPAAHCSHQIQAYLSTLKSPMLVCNNESIVNTIVKTIQYSAIFPNVTLSSNWDCIAQVLETLLLLGHSSSSLCHVRGHQDLQCPYEQLSLPEQLNCDADAIANRYYHDHPHQTYTTVHQFPAGECIFTTST